MDNEDYTTEAARRKRGRHFTIEERCEIQEMRGAGKSLRQIAAELGCSHTAVYYELKKNTPERAGGVGRIPRYNAARAQKAYEARRRHCRKESKSASPEIEPFIQWTAKKVKEEKWSLDACCGLAKKDRLFPAAGMVCTKTLYNMLRSGKLPLTLFDVPRAVSWKSKPRLRKKHKRLAGRSIEDRPECINNRREIGHWEADTVVGRRKGSESVILTLTERFTKMAITLKASSKSMDGISEAVEMLLEEYGQEHFGEVFKSITCDNGTEFAGFSGIERYGTLVYFAHPYSSFERGQNERFNSQLRRFVPKGKSIDAYSSDEILGFGDMINSTPRRILGYDTPENLFNEFLDSVYAL